MLPQLERDAQAQSLAQAFAGHLEQTRGHVERLEEVFRLVGAETSSNLDAAVEKLAAEHDKLAATIVDPVLRDVFHAAAAAKTEHYEIASYDTLTELARVLEAPDAVRLLEQTRAEEAVALELFESIAARLAKETG